MKSVRRRLRGDGPVAFELSGGVDSSAVVGMAKFLLDSGSIRTDGLDVFSLTVSEPESDEKSFQDDVVWMLQLPFDRLAAGPTDPKVCAAQAARYLDVPDFPNGQMMYPMMDLARRKGCRVYLTGEGGDHWLTGSNLYCADLMRQLRFVKLVRRLRFDRRFIGALGPINRRPTIWQVFARGVLRPLAAQVLPAGVRKRLRPMVGANSIPPFLDSEFAKRVCLAERLRSHHEGLRCSSFAQQTMYDVFNSSWETHTYELCERSASWHGFDARYSFHDRRLIEFAFGLPEEQRRRDDLTKFVLRNAIAGLVPDSVWLRRTKAEFSPQFLKAFESIDASMMLENLSINRRGWLHLQKVIKL